MNESIAVRVRWLRRYLRALSVELVLDSIDPPFDDSEEMGAWEKWADARTARIAGRQEAACRRLGLTPTEAYEEISALEQVESKYLPEDAPSRITRATMDLWSWEIWLPQWDEQLERNAEYVRSHPDDPRSKVLITTPRGVS